MRPVSFYYSLFLFPSKKFHKQFGLWDFFVARSVENVTPPCAAGSQFLTCILFYSHAFPIYNMVRPSIDIGHDAPTHLRAKKKKKTARAAPSRTSSSASCASTGSRPALSCRRRIRRRRRRSRRAASTTRRACREGSRVIRGENEKLLCTSEIIGERAK